MGDEDDNALRENMTVLQSIKGTKIDCAVGLATLQDVDCWQPEQWQTGGQRSMRCYDMKYTNREIIGSAVRRILT